MSCKIKINNAYKDSDGIWWIILQGTDTLMKTENNTLRKMVSLNYPEHNIENSIAKIVKLNDEVIIISRFRLEIWIFSKTKKKITFNKKFEDVNQISNAEIDEKDNVWIFPVDIDKKIIVFNIKEKKTREVEWNYKFKDAHIVTRTVKNKNKIYFATRNGEKKLIGRINMLTSDVKINVLEEAKYINCIDANEEYLWVLYLNDQRRTIITRVNNKSGKSKNYDISKIIKLNESTRNKYFKMYAKNEKIYLIENSAYTMTELNLDSMTATVIRDKTLCSDRENCIVRHECLEKDDFIYLFSSKLGWIQKFDKTKDELTIEHIELSNEVKSSITNVEIKNKKIYENEYTSLSDYVDFVGRGIE